jgi:hypothetical protein
MCSASTYVRFTPKATSIAAHGMSAKGQKLKGSCRANHVRFFPQVQTRAAKYLRVCYYEACQSKWEHVPEQLAYRDIIALADIFEGWALDKQVTPEEQDWSVGQNRCGRLLKKSGQIGIRQNRTESVWLDFWAATFLMSVSNTPIFFLTDTRARESRVRSGCFRYASGDVRAGGATLPRNQKVSIC